MDGRCKGRWREGQIPNLESSRQNLLKARVRKYLKREESRMNPRILSWSVQECICPFLRHLMLLCKSVLPWTLMWRSCLLAGGCLDLGVREGSGLKMVGWSAANYYQGFLIA